MRILLAHNYYQQAGGEDAVFKAEQVLLKDNGQEIFLFERNNAEIEKYSFTRKLEFFLSFDWSKRSYREFRRTLQQTKPDIVHLHNIFYLLTPSVYQAAHDEGVPVIQTQHNFRPLCANALFFRNNEVCEKCLTASSFWPAVRYRCFKDSFFMSVVMAKMLAVHKRKETWVTQVDHYIALSEFSRQKYITAGIPADKISVKPNFVSRSLPPQKNNSSYALYAGRLSEEKGITFLLQAWNAIKDVELKVVGSGPLAGELKAFSLDRNMNQVSFAGYLSEAKLNDTIQGAQFVVVPSLCYENFPRIIVEAYSFGIPVLASRLGSVAELVKDGQTGLTFNPADKGDLAQKVKWLKDHPQERQAMGQKARQIYEEKFTAKKNYEVLMAIYRKTIAEYKRK